MTSGLGEPIGWQEITAVPLFTAFVISSGSMLPLSKLGGAAVEERFRTSSKFVDNLVLRFCNNVSLYNTRANFVHTG